MDKVEKPFSGDLLKLITPPDGLRPPAKHRLLGAPANAEEVFIRELQEYNSAMLCHLIKEALRKMKLLKKHFGTDSDFVLALYLALKFVPGFSLTLSRPGHPLTWHPLIHLKLWADAERLKDKSVIKTDGAICKKLKGMEPWVTLFPTISAKRLQNQLSEARNGAMTSPFIKMIKTCPDLRDQLLGSFDADISELKLLSQKI